MSDDIPWQDQLHIQAAKGWLEQGNHAEADVELNLMSSQNRAHPEVLELRADIYLGALNPEAAVEVASTLIRVAPERPLGWVRLATGFCLLERYAEAKRVMKQAIQLFDDEWLMFYSLACAECQLGELGAARTHLNRAFELAGENANEVRLIAVGECHLEPLWLEIGDSGSGLGEHS